MKTTGRAVLGFCGTAWGTCMSCRTVQTYLRFCWLIGSDLSQQLSDRVIIKSSLVFKEHGVQDLLVSDCIGASCIDCIDPPPSFHRAGLAGTLQSCEAPDERDGEIFRPLLPSLSHSFVFTVRVISALLANCVGSEHVPALSLL